MQVIALKLPSCLERLCIYAIVILHADFSSWVAVKELNLSYYIGETLLLTI